MRFFPAMLGAVLITTAVFLFMQGLIKVQQNTGERLEVFQQVEIFRQPPPPEQPPEPERPPEESQQPEPQMEALALSVPTALPVPKLEVPALDLAVGDIEIAAIGDQFSAPLSGSGIGAGTTILDGKGKDAQGFIEVIPFTTRKPNVPELAWRNKVSGWVLVAFNVTPQGYTRNIRVLDANPRGVFEEKVVKAVEDWRYSVKSSGAVPKNLVMTQKVEVQWQDYSLNIDYLD